MIRFNLLRSKDFAPKLSTSAEVKQQADLPSGGFQIIDQLPFMLGTQCLNSFQFQHNQVFHDHVGYIISDKVTFIIYFYLLLAFHFHIPSAQLLIQSILIYLLQKAESQHLVYLKKCLDYLMCQFFVQHKTIREIRVIRA